MKNILFQILIFLLLLPTLVFSGTIDKTQLRYQKAYSIIGDLNIPSVNIASFPINNNSTLSGGTEEPLQTGYTYYDFANYGSLTKLIAVDTLSNIHFAWTCGLNLNSIMRHIYYNFYDGSFTWINGILAFASTRSGFCSIDVLSDGRAVICAHAQNYMGEPYPSVVAVDFMPGMGAFYPVTPIPNPIFCDSIMWPHMAVDINDNIYVFARCYPYSSGPDYTEVYYSHNLDPYYSAFSQFVFADTVNVPSFTVATSRISGRAAFGYHQFLEDYNNHPQWAGFLAMQLNNDAYVILKEDGQDWDWDNPINITHIIKGDAGLLPDTIQAQGDTLRAYLDIDLMFDNDDVLHAMFTCRGLYEAPWLSTTPPVSGITEASTIWHWREDTDSLNIVASGWWNCASTTANGGAGAWKSTICRPSMGIDEEGNIYCVFEGYKDWLSDPDTSVNGWGNGDIYVTVSIDGGYNWALPLNLTDTYSNGASAGYCMSECFPSLAETVDDSLHIFYMEDKDAGSYVFAEGISTNNPVWYMAFPKDSVPTTPLIEQYYFHVRPLFSPPPNISITMTPVNPPIIIPAGGGSFNYTVTIANQDSITVTFDAWIYAILPSGFYYGPIINRQLTLASGASLLRTMTQNVPGGAPSGLYTYIGYVGNFNAGVIWDSSYFNFTKLGFDGAGGNNNWKLTGWDQEIIYNTTATEFALFEPYPNPFNADANLSFSLAEAGEISLVVYDIQGRVVERIVEGWMPEGSYQVKFNGAELSSGVYFARLEAGGRYQSCKLLLLK